MSEVFNVHQQWFDPFGGFMVGGKVYYGKPNTDPTIVTNQIPVFSDRSLNTAAQLPNPQTIGVDGRVENKPWLGQRYSIEVYDVDNVLRYSNQDNGENPSTGEVLALSNVQGINIITAETPAGISEYVDKQIFTLEAVGENSGNVTIDIDQQGPRPLIYNFKEEIPPGFVQQNKSITFIYNGSENNFNWIDVGRGISLLTGVAGDGNTITAVGGPSKVSYIDKHIYMFRALSDSSGPVFLNVDVLGNIPVKKENNQDLVDKEILTDQDVIVSYNGKEGQFKIISQLSNQFLIKPKMCIPFFDVIANIPAGYIVCDGNNGTPNLNNGRFIRGSLNDGSNNGVTGGSTTTGSTTLTIAQMPSHNHTNTSASIPGAVSGGNPPGLATGSVNTGLTGDGGGHTHPGNEPPFTNVLWIMKT